MMKYPELRQVMLGAGAYFVPDNFSIATAKELLPQVHNSTMEQQIHLTTLNVGSDPEQMNLVIVSTSEKMISSLSMQKHSKYILTSAPSE